MDKPEPGARRTQRVEEDPTGKQVDGLDRYRTPGEATLSQPERVEFRRTAEQRLGGVITSLEQARDQMKSLHTLAKGGQGPGTREYDQTFRQAKESYVHAIEQASKLLYEKDGEGRLTPNSFYRETERERVRLQQDMSAARSNPSEYQWLSQQHAMLGDVLRANGYAHANFGLAMVRSSVYLPKEQRDQQVEQGNSLMMLASRYDKWMMGDPPQVSADPNFMKHRNAIMRAVTNTPYVDGPRTEVRVRVPTGSPVGPLPRQQQTTELPVRPPLPAATVEVERKEPVAPVQPAATTGDQEIAKLRQKLTLQERDSAYTMEQALRNPAHPLNRYANDVQRLESERKAHGDNVANLGKQGSTQQQQALGWMWNNVTSVQDLKNFLAPNAAPDVKAIADTVRSHPKFNEIHFAFFQMLNKKFQLAALDDGLKNNSSTRAFWEKRQEIQKTKDSLTALERARQPAVVPPSGRQTERPPEVKAPGAAVNETAEISPELRAKVAPLAQVEQAVKSAATAYAEVSAQQRGFSRNQSGLSQFPKATRDAFANINKVIRDNPHNKVEEMVEAQRKIYTQILDKMVPKNEQQPIRDQLTTLRGNVDAAAAKLKPETQDAVSKMPQTLAAEREQLVAKYLRADANYVRETQSVLNATAANSPQRANALRYITTKYQPQVEANPKFQAEASQLENNAYARLAGSDPNMTAVIAARKALGDYLAGSDGTPNQTAADKALRAKKASAVDNFDQGNKTLDMLVHAKALIQSYEARALLLSPHANDHQRAAELMYASSQDVGAAKYLAGGPNRAAAVSYTANAAEQAQQASAPIKAFGTPIPGTGTIARGMAAIGNGRVFNGRLENQSAATLQLAESFAVDPRYSKERLAALTEQANRQGVGLLRDGGSIAAYGASYYGMGLLKYGGKALPGPAKVVAAALVAAAASDVIEDGNLNGPINDPGAWARGAGMGLGGHGVYNTLLGKWSHAALAQSAEARIATLGGEAALKAPGATWQTGLKETAAAVAKPGNFLGRNPLVTETSIATADAAKMLAIKHNLAAMQYHRTVQTAFAVGAGSESLKIIDGDIKVNTASEAGTTIFKSGTYAALTSGLVAPAVTALPRIGLSKIPSMAPALASKDAAMTYAFARTYASDVTRAGNEYLFAIDLQSAADAARDPEALARAYQKLNPKATDAEARAKAAVYIQMRRGQEQFQPGK